MTSEFVVQSLQSDLGQMPALYLVDKSYSLTGPKFSPLCNVTIRNARQRMERWLSG